MNNQSLILVFFSEPQISKGKTKFPCSILLSTMFYFLYKLLLFLSFFSDPQILKGKNQIPLLYFDTFIGEKLNPNLLLQHDFLKEL